MQFTNQHPRALHAAASAGRGRKGSGKPPHAASLAAKSFPRRRLRDFSRARHMCEGRRARQPVSGVRWGQAAGQKDCL
jgi:hypothetical protein